MLQQTIVRCSEDSKEGPVGEVGEVGRGQDAVAGQEGGGGRGLVDGPRTQEEIGHP